MPTTWRCRACLTVNEGRKRKCGACLRKRPKRRRPTHLKALDIPYEEYVRINGGENCGVATCQKPPSPTRRNDRDHDHRSGKPRGILCPAHNRFLHSRVTPEELRACADYLERAEIEERVNAATEGPWYAVVNDLIGGLAVTNRDVPLSDFDSRDPANVDVADIIGRATDAVFIAHAREDIPYLLAELRAAREREEQLRERVAELEAVIRDAQALHRVGYGDTAGRYLANAAVPAARDQEGQAS